MDYLKVNKNLWNRRTSIHYDSKFYDVKGFLAGKDSLKSIELALLGDIQEQSILHLQCHFGQDSISLAHRGAKVTAVDFSSKAIEKANELNRLASTDVQFIECDVFSLKNILDKKFDIVFTSYGVLGWLPDMKQWAETVAHFLKPGGKLVLAEFHPVVWMFSDDFQEIEYRYSSKEPIVEISNGTYTNEDANLQDEFVSWNHGLSDVLNNLIAAGLSIQDFQEYDYSPYACFRNTVQIGESKYQISGLEGKIPMVYSLVGEKNL